MAQAADFEPLLLDAKDLMTGSGKTGLCVSLLEEAVIDGVSAIAPAFTPLS